ncbi:uncharacterized protein PgNI_12064 [Pyricularia grisea]|uniref:Uncharacterized protein n=1 Tax=Pyricularia grisea TaxID=148305 RepID=A0A6P8ALY4_PYRGI|nr:uncharacterized protein PgNI_12589 [Pyricularia grisea]XP_030977313.1 uncharacterized protein PgNI_12064 [Pyricularia grisea]TLD03084.1 hypothetical protein PgNI_12589 [Pyricularia grisea]TLD04467.1 hypothetical protein PgNI_12064 [Pyricularia grisea]
MRGNRPRYLFGYTAPAHFEHKIIPGKRNCPTDAKWLEAKDGFTTIVPQ